MMVHILSLILFLIFVTLSGFHFYWIFGGTWGLKSVIPTKENEEKTPSIPQLATLIVALGLLLFGFLYLIKLDFVYIYFPNWITNYAYWLIPSIFTIRAIGEFNYVGIFKKIKHTDFAKADSKVFVPLCLAIGISGILIQLLS